MIHHPRKQRAFITTQAMSKLKRCAELSLVATGKTKYLWHFFQNTNYITNRLTIKKELTQERYAIKDFATSELELFDTG